MEPDDPLGDEEAGSRLLPPDDRLWRHPSEVGAEGLPPMPTGTSWRTARPWLATLSAGLIGAMFTIGVMAATGNLRRIRKVPVVDHVTMPVVSLSTGTGPASPGVLEISRRLRPAIVQLEVEIDGVEQRVLGAGVVFGGDGQVLTNHHVVQGAKRIIVVTADGRRSKGTLVGADAWSDIAVVKVDDGITVPPARMGSAAGLEVGQHVMVIGGPSGPDDDPAVAVGVVGALGRQVDRAGAPALLDMIETDTPVTATWSGGALVDGTGAVVGITTAVVPAGPTSTAGTGFATPIDWARAVADQLLASGKAVHVWMGVEGSDLDAETARSMGVGGGAVVSLVRAGSPAGDAGLSAGDVITTLDGVPVASMGALRILLRAHRPGEVVTVSVMRGAQARPLTVRLAERPAQT